MRSGCALNTTSPSDRLEPALKIALIPCRGGSKRIPGKNIKLFAGRPMLAYPIEAARRSGLFDRIIISTDSDEIARVARAEGADVPFIRPPELSGDDVPTIPVIKHAIKWLNSRGPKVKYCCCIYANPFVEAADLVDAFEILCARQATSVVPVTTYAAPIYSALKVDAVGRVDFVFPEESAMRTQDMARTFYDAGQFYWWDCAKLTVTADVAALRREDRYSLVIPRSRVQDLDTPDDWAMADHLYSLRARKEEG